MKRDFEISIVLSGRNVPGQSGGPVLSRDGLVVGIVDEEKLLTTTDQETGRSTAIPAYLLRDLEGASDRSIEE
jgi:hypothetical protein